MHCLLLQIVESPKMPTNVVQTSSMSRQPKRNNPHPQASPGGIPRLRSEFPAPLFFCLQETNQRPCSNDSQKGELVIVTRNNMRSVSAEEATSNILGYTIGNDLTARMYQSPDIGGGQFTYAKAFDKFAPMGPRLVHPSRFSISAAKLQTRVNGKTLQDSPLDFIFPVGELISFLSQGEW